MRDPEKSKFLKMMQATLAVYDKTASVETVCLWWNLLSCYDFADVEIAFSRYLKSAEGRFSPKPASIIAIINAMRPDGRPGVDEAWAMIPRDECVSAVITEEMAEAYGIAKPLLDDGDQVAARMAFKDAYGRIVEKNKIAGIAPKWFPSLGSDPMMRETVLAEAVRLGRLGCDHAAKSVPEIADQSKKHLAVENKTPISNAKALENIAKIRQMLGGSHLVRGAV